MGVTAVDRDVGPNGRVTYRLQGGDCSRFNLDNHRGIITSATFMSGAGTRFQCTIEARDQVIDRRFTVIRYIDDFVVIQVRKLSTVV